MNDMNFKFTKSKTVATFFTGVIGAGWFWRSLECYDYCPNFMIEKTIMSAGFGLGVFFLVYGIWSTFQKSDISTGVWRKLIMVVVILLLGLLIAVTPGILFKMYA